nr:hypothetical protein [Tanacetum cinerariifolium]
MARLLFCDYHNMVVILEKGEHNVDFHPMVDFIEASPLRYALTIKPTIYVTHIRQFWSTARIETTGEGTKILTTVDGIVRTVSESSLRRNLKLRDKEGINSLPDTELFTNLTLMGYNISPNQNPKSTRFNEFSSNIATALICLASNKTYNFSKMIFDCLVKNVNNKISKFLMYPRFLTMCLRMSQFSQITHTHTYVVPFHTRKLFTTLRVNSPSFSGRIVPLFETMLVQQGVDSGTPTESHHTPSPEAPSPSHTTHISPSLPPVTTTSIPTVTPAETTPIRQYTQRARIAQSYALPTIADEPVSPQRDVSQGEAYPTDSGFIADQDRATIAESSTLPHDSAPWVSSPAAIEGSMQQTIPKLTALYTSLQRQLSELTDKFQAREVEINRLKARVKLLEERKGLDAPIKGRSMDKGEAATKRVSDDTEEMATVLTPMDAAIVLASGVIDVPTSSGSIPTASIIAEGSVPTGSEEVPTASPVFATATVVTPVTRRKGKEIKRKGLNLELENTKKQKILEEVPEEAMFPEEVIEEKVKEMMQLVPIEEVYVEALQVKHPIIGWKVYTEGQRSYWKITRLGGSSASYQFFIDLLKHLDKEDLNQLWRLVKETLSNRPPTSKKKMELWVELNRMYEPDKEDQL